MVTGVTTRAKYISVIAYLVYLRVVPQLRRVFLEVCMPMNAVTTHLLTFSDIYVKTVLLSV